MTNITFVSAGGDYLDPWHDFDGVMQVLLPTLHQRGSVVVRRDVEVALAEVGETTPDLLVLNIGNSPAGDAPAVVRSGLASFLRAGGRMLALHSTSTAFAAWPEWEQLLGGRWVRGTSFHPAYGPGRVHVREGWCEVPSFDTSDEFYSQLTVAAKATVLAEHTVVASAEPIVWRHQVGQGSVVYDALGHDVAASATAQRLALFAAEVDLLLVS